jgi:hypothetical protein
LHLVEVNFLTHGLFGHGFSKFVANDKKPAVAYRVSGPNLGD